jgi:hypothetical protein
VSIAVPTTNFDSVHSSGQVFPQNYCFLVGWLAESRPTALAREFVVTLEEEGIAANTAVLAVLGKVPVGIFSKRGFCPVFPENSELFGCEQFSPF